MALSASDAGRPSVARRLFELDPLPPERLALETTPNVDVVAGYVFTRAAERSWQVLNQHLAANEGALFWIGGPAGCGKTHFLDYVLALESRAGALGAENARRLVCGLEVAERVSPAQLELDLLRIIAEQIGADYQNGNCWQNLRGAPALTIALDSARRTGVRAVTVALDFGLSDCAAASDFLAVLAEVAAKFTAVKFTVIAAGHGKAPDFARNLEVAPHDPREEILVAVRRARRLTSSAERDAARAYAGIDTAGFAPETIFPFHPLTLTALRSIATPAPATIPALSRLARECITTPRDCDEALDRLVYPADLATNPAISKQVEIRLARVGRAARKIAHHALERSFEGNHNQLAREIVDTLMLESLCGGTRPLALEEIVARMPMLVRNGDAADALPSVRSLLRQLQVQTGGVIRFDADAARFDPEAAGAPALASFNAALTLLRRFEPTLNPAPEINALALGIKRLERAMAAAVESAARTREALSSALDDSHLPIPTAHRAALAQYIELAESGSAALIETGADPAQREAALRVIANYEALAKAAASIPRMRAMREYLAATGLRAAPEMDRGGESASAALETECELLTVALGPRVLTGAPRNLDALEARFQRFKWTYVQCYLSAHEKWRAKMERLAMLLEDAERYRDALGRLNRIAALGPPEGERLAERVAEIAASVIRCEPAAPLAPETTPRCASCGFILGAAAPDADLDNVRERLRHGLSIKLAALSQSMIARLIREHDRDNRLEGFLKITQASQTDALVRVLDEKLARYLAQVLDDNLDGRLRRRSDGRRTVRIQK